MNVYATDGHGFEREFCGIAFPDVDARLRAERVPSFKEGLKRVKGCQRELNWNPKRPKTELAHCLFRRVSKNLKNGKNKLRLYIAIGTRLDMMGIDLFFEYDSRTVTIDLTVRERKDRARADIVITRDNMVRDEHYQIGDEIARMLLSPRTNRR